MAAGEVVLNAHIHEAFTRTEGRTVALKIAEGQYRPALIAKCWGDPDKSETCVNLVVLLDGSNDDYYDLRAAGVYRDGDSKCLAWATSRVQGPGIGQWLPRAPRATYPSS